MKRKKVKKKVKTIPDKIQKKYFRVYDAVFTQRIHVLLNHSEKDYEKWLNRNKVKDLSSKNFTKFGGFCSSMESENGLTEWLIVLPEFNWTIKHQGTLIHEITHAVVRIWASNNIPFNSDTQEFLAHSIGNMYEDIARKLLVIEKK